VKSELKVKSETELASNVINLSSQEIIPRIKETTTKIVAAP
jgi:hypothetical protein